MSRWWHLSELRLLVLGLPLELLWEIAQFPLYDVWHEHDWGYILYALAHCSAGDLLILLVAYESVALLRRDRYWFRNSPWTSGLAFTLLGAGYTVLSELRRVRVLGSWAYTELMPVVPVIGIGGMPFLQWLLIPPVLVTLVRFVPEQEGQGRCTRGDP